MVDSRDGKGPEPRTTSETPEKKARQLTASRCHDTRRYDSARRQADGGRLVRTAPAVFHASGEDYCWTESVGGKPPLQRSFKNFVVCSWCAPDEDEARESAATRRCDGGGGGGILVIDDAKLLLLHSFVVDLLCFVWCVLHRERQRSAEECHIITLFVY